MDVLFPDGDGREDGVQVMLWGDSTRLSVVGEHGCRSRERETPQRLSEMASEGSFLGLEALSADSPSGSRESSRERDLVSRR